MKKCGSVFLHHDTLAMAVVLGGSCPGDSCPRQGCSGVGTRVNGVPHFFRVGMRSHTFLH